MEQTHTSARPIMKTRKRYRSVTISVGLMLMLMGGVGYFNYRENTLMNRNAEHIDVAGYASDAFYKIILNSHYLESDLYRLQAAQTGNTPHSIKTEEQQRIHTTLAQLRQEADDIDEFLSVLRTGGPFDRNAEPTVIAPLTHVGVEPALTQVEGMWHPYRDLVNEALAADLNTPAGQAALTRLVDHARQNQVPVYDTLDIIIADLTQENVDRNERIAWVLLASALTLLLFLIFFVGFIIRRLNQTDSILAEAHQKLETSYHQVIQTKTALEQSYAALDTTRQATQAIMDNVSTGLGLINSDLHFNPKYSQQLETLLGTPHLTQRSLVEILGDITADHDAVAALPGFVAQLFQTRVQEHWINDLNPLHKLAVNYPNPEQGQDGQRYLSFQFKRVWHKQADGSRRIIGLLTSVDDITEAVILQDKVLRERESQRLQLDTLNRITQSEVGMLDRFVQSLNKHNDAICQTLQQEGYNNEFFRNKRDTLTRHIQALKNEADNLDLTWFVRLCSKAEAQLAALEHKSVLAGDDFMATADTAEALSQFTHTINTLLQRKQHGSTAAAPTADAIAHPATQWKYTELNDEFAALIQDHSHVRLPSQTVTASYATELAAGDQDSLLQLFAQQLPYFVQELADRSGKQVQLQVHGLTTTTLSDDETILVQDLLIPLLRNSITHGIESPAQRQAHNKPASGTICIHLEADDKYLNLSVADDGRGLDIEAIKTQAAQQGWMSREQADALSDKELIRMIFSRGFSTATTASEQNGGGMGLDIIRAQVCKTDPPGQLDIHSTPGQGFTLALSLPRHPN